MNNAEAMCRPHEGLVWWIDDTGRWLSFDGSYALRFPDCFFPNIEHRHGPVFDTLGMAKVTTYARLIDCQWDVQRITRGALSALLDFLISLESPGNDRVPVALKFYFGAWNSEVFSGPGAALERILELDEYAHTVPGESITIASVDLKDINRSHDSIRRCYDTWKEMSGLLEDGDSCGLGDLFDRSLILGLDSLQQQLVYKVAGSQSLASQILGSTWRYDVLGMSLGNSFSDDDYEAEVCSDYPVVMSSAEPRLDHICAYFHLKGEDPIWLNYERLLLPWKTRKGEPMIMCFSQQSQNLRIPFLSATVGFAA